MGLVPFRIHRLGNVKRELDAGYRSCHLSEAPRVHRYPWQRKDRKLPLADQRFLQQRPFRGQHREDHHFTDDCRPSGPRGEGHNLGDNLDLRLRIRHELPARQAQSQR